MIKHCSIVVSGKVQGVFFRASTKQKADELLLKGFVRNEPDGTVYIEAEGDEELLEAFIKWCNTGPPRARVEGCSIEEGHTKGFKQFLVYQ